MMLNRLKKKIREDLYVWYVVHLRYNIKAFGRYIKHGLLIEDLHKLLGKNPYYNPNQIIGFDDAKNKVEKLLTNRHDKNAEHFVIRDSKMCQDKYAWGIEFEIIDLNEGLGYKDFFIVDKETAAIIPTDYISENGLELLKEYTFKRKRKN